nr:actin-related protein 7 [Tanacetum cinerariifolium]
MNDDGSVPDSPSLLANNVDPVVRGFVKDWDAMEDLLHHVLYNGLGWEIGNEGQILFADPLLTPKAVREQLVQLMFETFNISGFYASEQAVLSLYAVGRISGCTVDIGHGKIVVRGFVKDWDAMEDLLHHVLYNGLGWEIGNEGQILFADPLLTPKAVREQLVQLMFETFNISG